MRERLCVVMPVYNEEAAIGGVLAKWADALQALVIDFVIRPYNDGSKDESLPVMRAFANQHPDAHVEVRDKPNGGHGQTILTGYREAADDGFDWIFQIDSDDEMGPEGFAQLWNRRSHDGGHDFLVGIRDGRIQALPRKIISLVSRCCVRLFYGRKTVWDVNVPYRLMRVSAFKTAFERIPLSTFAPNVILSGIVAREKLRFFETRVPQHDRTTGEVSIKKWKLLKAAVRSFVQTVAFSFKGDEGQLGVALSVILSGGIACAYICFADYLSLPWCDEVGTADAAVNLSLNRGWGSQVWTYSYNVLHVHLLWGWLKGFGISHRTVCALDVVLAWCSFAALACAAYRTHLCRKALSFLLLSVCFWLLPVMFRTINGGRIDTLVMLFTILSVWSIVRLDGCDDRRKANVFLSSFLLMLSGVYSVPPIAALCALQVLCSIRDRRELRREISLTLAAATGFLLGYLLCCAFYFRHGYLLQFVNTYLCLGVGSLMEGPSPLSRIADSHLRDGLPFLFLAGGVGLGVSLPKLRFSRRIWCLLLWVACIPLVMTLAGRYERYYRWLFVLPVVLTGIGILERFNQKAVSCLALAGVLACSAASLSGLVQQRALTFRSLRRLSCDIRDSNVILSDERLYYHLVKTGNALWRIRYRGQGPSFRGKVERAIDSLALEQNTKDRIIRLVNRIVREDETLPAEGYLVGLDETDFKADVDKLKAFGYQAEVQASHGPVLRAKFFLGSQETVGDNP